MLGYSAVLALAAGFVNAVALLVLAFPVGNLTGVTTQLGMNTANPLLYEGHVLAAIILGFLVGAAMTGSLLGSTQALMGKRHATVLVIEALLLLAAGVVETQFEQHVASLGIEGPVVQGLLCAMALGMQNGLTSSFRGMAIRTTHFTGTVTDLGLMLGRNRHQGIDRWKFAILSSTLLLFLAGGVAGLMVGAQVGGYALIVPAAMLVVTATVAVVHRCRSAQPAESSETGETAPTEGSTGSAKPDSAPVQQRTAMAS